MIEELANHNASSHFSEKEKVALDFAEEITITDRKVSHDTWEKLEQHFSDDEIVELTGLIAFQNLSSKFNEALNIEPQGFCQIPSKKE